MQPKRFLTATALFDGHDASINVFRRLLIKHHAEVIHIGHNRSCHEVVTAALDEDVDGIAVSSYQGGHVEFFPYMRELLDKAGASHVVLFGGGGGVIVPEEIAYLESHGVSKIYSPLDGQKMGLDGIIADMLERTPQRERKAPDKTDASRLGTSTLLSAVLDGADSDALLAQLKQQNDERKQTVPVIGLTGTGGAGKSSFLDELVRRFSLDFPDKKIGIIAIDPQKKRTGGALLGDRIRMNAVYADNVYLRSLAIDTSENIEGFVSRAVEVFVHQGFDLVFVETAGIGQVDTAIVAASSLPVYVMTSEYGAESQLEKINMLDYAKMVVLNKFENKRAEDALRAVRKQYRRNFDIPYSVSNEELPIFGTCSNRFNDAGVNAAYLHLLGLVNQTWSKGWEPPRSYDTAQAFSVNRVNAIIPPERQHYLAEIVNEVRTYKKRAGEAADAIAKAAHLEDVLRELTGTSSVAAPAITHKMEILRQSVADDLRQHLAQWDENKAQYQGEEASYTVRGKKFSQKLYQTSLSGLSIPKVVLPNLTSKEDEVRFALLENLPGYFPYTAGVFPFKRADEDPKRMFAGEGPPERTNARFHLLCKGEKAKRLSTAFDSVTLYGEDPDERPDIYGKIGESGVSIATLDDMKKLYAGFDLCDKNTSVSKTINGPAPIILAMFFNTAIDQQVERYKAEHGKTAVTAEEYAKIKTETLQQVRGTVQADILKEDQAQNTCIFSTDIALKMMADMQEFCIHNQVRNYYSVSISGYHIAEAGANPISQLAFTLSNGFTLVEYYLARGMKIDDVAPNLSFFFSTGMDPEYAVIGRVARRIWAIAMKYRYGANERSQMLKYHIQTSGRSLHAQEMQYNDIRTTLQALTAIYDNCNSLHTNAYDEAVTTPTEQSVRNAMAIQLIITKELGQSKNENILQGSYFIERLTELVEEAVLNEFLEISNRGGTLKAMEMQYHRAKIQDESLTYELQKHSGELPLVGVNTFINENKREVVATVPLSRSTTEEKRAQIANLRAFQARNAGETPAALNRLRQAVLDNKNIFAELMETVKSASLGQISHALYEVGGQYRRAL